MRVLLGAVALAVFVAQLLVVAPAAACSRVMGLQVRVPGDGAEGVPTNVVPWLAGYTGSGEVDVRLFDSTGAIVATELVRVGVSVTRGSPSS